MLSDEMPDQDETDYTLDALLAMACADHTTCNGHTAHTLLDTDPDRYLAYIEAVADLLSPSFVLDTEDRENFSDLLKLLVRLYKASCALRNASPHDAA